MVPLLFGVFLVLVSPLGAWHAIRAYRSAKLELKWVAVPGRVISAAVQLSGGNFVPVVKYSYRFGGASFTGNRLRSTGISTDSRHPAEADVARYPSGVEITVFVNPGAPTESVVEPGTKKWYLPGVVFGCALVAYIGVAMIRKSLS